MRRRDDKIARAAHIKERTHGTSNEISFSVLDAAKYKETTQRFSLRDLLADRRDTNIQSVSRETGEHVSRETSNHRALAGSHAAESGARRRRSGVWFKRKSAKQATQRNKATHASGYSEEASSQTPAGAKRMSIEQEIARRKARRRKGKDCCGIRCGSRLVGNRIRWRLDVALSGHRAARIRIRAYGCAETGYRS